MGKRSPTIFGQYTGSVGVAAIFLVAEAATLADGGAHDTFVLVVAILCTLGSAIREGLVLGTFHMQHYKLQNTQTNINSRRLNIRLTIGRYWHTLVSGSISLEASVAHTSSLWWFKQTTRPGIVRSPDARLSSHLPVFVFTTLDSY